MTRMSRTSHNIYSKLVNEGEGEGGGQNPVNVVHGCPPCVYIVKDKLKLIIVEAT